MQKIQVCSIGEVIFVLGRLRKKYSARCQILRSKFYLNTVQQKVFFNIVKESFKSFEVLRRNVKIQKGSTQVEFLVLGGLRKST